MGKGREMDNLTAIAHARKSEAEAKKEQQLLEKAARVAAKKVKAEKEAAKEAKNEREDLVNSLCDTLKSPTPLTLIIPEEIA